MTKKKQVSMLDYFEDKMNQLDFDGDLSLNWDPSAHVFELMITLTAQNDQHITLENQAGDETDENVVSYEDAILFYDQRRVNGDEYADNYLALIPFDAKTGMNKAEADDFFAYFQDVLDDGMSDLLDFLDPDTDQTTFELQWSVDKFAAAVAAQPRYKQNEWLTYPRY